VTSHSGISDLVVGQLGPTGSFSIDNSLPFVDCPLPYVHEEEIVAALALSPSDTSPGIDEVTYPFIWWLRKKWPDQFDDMVRRAIDSDHSRFHCAEAVLIPKAAEPRYDVVKSWRMIVLLSTFAKLLERIILRRLVMSLELGETQFGSWEKCDTHDAMANVLELL